MKFKEEHMRAQYESRPTKLKEICAEFCRLSLAYGVEPVVTRVTDKVKGESGVHPAGRAVDFRDEVQVEKGRIRRYTDEQADAIVKALNEKFPRKDGLKVAIHHRFKGMPAHFHLQIPFDWA